MSHLRVVYPLIRTPQLFLIGKICSFKECSWGWNHLLNTWCLETCFQKNRILIFVVGIRIRLLVMLIWVQFWTQFGFQMEKTYKPDDTEQCQKKLFPRLSILMQFSMQKKRQSRAVTPPHPSIDPREISRPHRLGPSYWRGVWYSGGFSTYNIRQDRL